MKKAKSDKGDIIGVFVYDTMSRQCVRTNPKVIVKTDKDAWVKSTLELGKDKIKYPHGISIEDFPEDGCALIIKNKGDK